MTLKTRPIRINLTAPDGSPMAGMGIVASLTVQETDGGLVVPAQVGGSTDVDGSALLHLWPNSRGSAGSQYRVRSSRNGDLLLNVLITVPDGDALVEIAIEDIINQAPYPAVDAAQQALTDTQAAALLAKEWATKTSAEVETGQGYGAKKYAQDAAASAAAAAQDLLATHADVQQTGADVVTAGNSAATATTKAGEASTSASSAAATLAQMQSLFNRIYLGV